MTQATLAAALEKEHHDIDEGIVEYSRSLREADGNPRPLLQAVEALRRHIYLEERYVFPPLREAGLVMPVFVMLREHGEIWDAMDDLEARLREDAPASELQTACHDLLARLEQHNAKEEPIIYPQTDTRLSPAEADELRVFLEDGRMPEGWRCEKASA